MADPASTSIVPSVITGIVGLTSTLATLVVNWIRERDAAANRVKRVEEATKRVAFWDQWWKMQQTIVEGDELARAKEFVRSQLIPVTAELIYKPEKSREGESSRLTVSWVRKVLFFYKPSSKIAYLPRVFFWLLVASFIYSMLVRLYMAVAGYPTYGEGMWVAYLIFLACILALWLAGWGVERFFEKRMLIARVGGDVIRMVPREETSTTVRDTMSTGDADDGA